MSKFFPAGFLVLFGASLIISMDIPKWAIGLTAIAAAASLFIPASK